MTLDIPLSEIKAGWDIDTTTIPIVSPATEATGWYFPVSGGAGKRIAAKVTPKARPSRDDLKAKGQMCLRIIFVMFCFKCILLFLDCSVFIN